MENEVYKISRMKVNITEDDIINLPTKTFSVVDIEAIKREIYSFITWDGYFAFQSVLDKARKLEIHPSKALYQKLLRGNLKPGKYYYYIHEVKYEN